MCRNRELSKITLGEQSKTSNMSLFAFKKAHNIRMCSSVCTGYIRIRVHIEYIRRKLGSWQEWFSPGELWGFHCIYSLYFYFKTPWHALFFPSAIMEKPEFACISWYFTSVLIKLCAKKCFGTCWAELLPIETFQLCPVNH